MTRYLCMLCLIVFCTTSCSKKNADLSEINPEQTEMNSDLSRLDRKSMMMANQLGLNSKKAEALLAIEKKYQKKRMELKESGEKDNQVLFAGIKSLMSQQDDEIKELLSNKEYTKYLELKNSKKSVKAADPTQ